MTFSTGNYNSTRYLLIGKMAFLGPLPLSTIEERSGVYIVACPVSNGQYKLIDVGESENISRRLNGHEREDCWKERCKDYKFFVQYCSEEDRMKIEHELRKDRNDHLCGER